MKTAIKLALAASVLASSASFANTLLATTTSTGGQTGSDLILFVTDQTTNTGFAYDTGVTLDSVAKISDVATAVTGNSGTTFADVGGTGSSLSFGSSSTFSAFNSGAGAILLSGFLSTTAGDTVVWALNAGDGKTNSTNTIGGNRLIVSATAQPSWTGTLTNSGAKGGVSALNNLINAWNNANPSTAVSTSIGWGFGNSSANSAPYGYYGTNVVSGAAVGTAQYLYLVANNVAGGSTVAGVQATTGSFTLGSNGQLSFTAAASPQVPVPGAAWLLGSGLMGLVGISRRRRA